MTADSGSSRSARSAEKLPAVIQGPSRSITGSWPPEKNGISRE